MRGGRQFFEYRGRCIWCDIIAQEQADGARVIHENADAIVLAPFASRFPFEAWVLPRCHQSRFDEIDDTTARSVAEALLCTLGKLERGLGSPPYNFMVHSGQFRVSPLPAFHWHIEITPRLTKIAGFEWGSGFYINPVPPEEAARFLKEVKAPAKEMA